MTDEQRTGCLESAEGEGMKNLSPSSMYMDFIAVLCHEVRSPLAGILGFADMLESSAAGQLSQRQLRYLKAIRESASRLEVLFDALSDWAHPERGTENAALAPVSITREVQAVVENVRAEAEDRDILVDFSDGAGSELVMADRLRMPRVVHWLLELVLKNTRRGGQVNLKVRVSNGSVDIEASSNSSVISFADVEPLLKAYRDSSVEIPKHLRSVAFNLSVMRRLVEVQGGRLYANGAGENLTLGFCVPISSNV
jgi:signal transduction histidine kinase